MPLGLALALGLTAMLLMAFRRLRFAGLALSFGLAMLWIFSTPFIAQLLLASLEDQSAVNTRLEQADVAMLLGGMLEGVNSEDGEPGLGEAAIALFTRSLYRAGRVRWILASAGNLPWLDVREPEARSIASLLKEWGVPQNALLLETESRNTFENARLSKPIWDAHLFKERSARHLRFPHAARPRRVPARGFQCRTVASRFWRQTTARRRYSRFHARCFGT